MSIRGELRTQQPDLNIRAGLPRVGTVCRWWKESEHSAEERGLLARVPKVLPGVLAPGT